MARVDQLQLFWPIGLQDKLCNLLSNITSPAVVLGDLNFPGIDSENLHASSEAEKRGLETIQNHFWMQHVDFPTRKDPISGTESLLDPCLCEGRL